MSIRICENAHAGFEEFSYIRIFTPEIYLFTDLEFMYQRIYNLVLTIVRSITVSEYDILEEYINSLVNDKYETNKIMEFFRKHTSYFVNICNYVGKNGTTHYVKFLLSSIYPIFYCVDSTEGSKKLSNYLFGDQIPCGAENIISIIDLDEILRNVMSSNGCQVKNDSFDILHFRSTFKSFESNQDHWIRFRF